MTQMKGMILFNEYMESLEKLPPEDFKNLFVNLNLYNQGKEIGELSPMAELLWPIYAAKVDQMRESYEKRCQKNRENASRRKSKQAQAQSQVADPEVQFRTQAADTPDDNKQNAQETAFFTDSETEHMNYTLADSTALTTEHNRTNATERQTLSNGERMEANGYQSLSNANQSIANGYQTLSNGYQHNITETITKTETETETETKTEAVTETKTKTVSVTEAEAQAQAETEQSRSRDVHDGVTGTGIGTGIGIGGDGGSGMDEGKKKDLNKPTKDEVRRYCGQYALLVDADRFYQYYEERGWSANGEPIQSWRAMADHWQKLGEGQRAAKQTTRDDAPFSSEPKANYDLDAFVRASMERPFDFEAGY